MKKLTLLLLAGLCSVGCSADRFRQSADNEVLPMVKDRERKTLGYAPQVEVKQSKAPALAKTAYEKIPQTPIPPPQPVPLETPIALLPNRPLGPEYPPNSGASSDEIDRELGVGTDGDSDGSDPLYGPPTPRALRRLFSLFDSLAYGTQHSRPYQSQMEDLYLAALDVTLQRHLFAPQPYGNVGLQYTGGQSLGGGLAGGVKYDSALAATSTIGVRQNLPYGGQLTAQTLVQFVDALNKTTESGESAQVALTGSIPLLRGAGLVNLEPLILTERSLVYQVREFEQYRRTFMVSVARQYFNLLVLQQRVSNRQLNVSNLTLLLIRTQALFDAGRINFLEVQRSQQALFDGENSLSTSLISYRNAVDQFKVLLGMPVTEDMDVMPVELDVTVPDTRRDDVLATAHRYRLDLQTVRDQIDDAKRQVDVARNGLLPDLNVTVQGQFGNPIDSPAKNLNDRSTSYSAAINLGLPLDRLAERNSYRRALIAFDRAQRSFVDLRDAVTAGVLADVRQIHSAQVSVDIQRRSIKLAERRLEYSLELLRRGTGNARDVTDAQSSLLTAQDSFSQARSDLQVQVLQFLNDSGTLRVDPNAGSIGRALNRATGESSADREQDQPEVVNPPVLGLTPAGIPQG